jgi:tRNA A-37 threonylcarbamoyl transferase component Bud32
MIETRTCPACETQLSKGVPDVFCPTCALRHALAAGVGSENPAMTYEKAQAFDRVQFRDTHSASKSSAPAPGDVIEDYEILEQVGGNMGLVFKARHRLLHRVVALKIFPSEWITDAARLARFEREIRVMGQLSHQNLVTAADARNVNSWRLVVMEWIDGVDFQQFVSKNGPLPIHLACEAVRQAALGLQYAHEHGLIHRDIKPSNLMLTRSGAVKVIDMGLALAMEETTAQVTRPGAVLGTISYCAPEQFRDASTVDVRADIYSLGCTLFHLVTGKPPYGERRSFAEIVQAHLNEPFPAFSESGSDIPDDLDDVLARMTAKDPSSRFPSASAVAQALEPFASGANLSQLHMATTQPGALRRLPSGPPPTGAAPPPRRASMRMAVVAFVLLTAAIAAGIFSLMHLTDANPVVVLMDTTAAGGVYDDDRREAGGTNAEELSKVLHPLLPTSTVPEPVSSKWDREAAVLAMRPKLILIHRSLFFHSLNAELKFGAPPFTNEVDALRWRTLYRISDERLRVFMGFIATSNPDTKFLVYSRGTDENWLDKDFQEKWKNELADRFPALHGRITTMLIKKYDRAGGTFRDPKTAEEIRGHVKKILHLKEKEKSD